METRGSDRLIPMVDLLPPLLSQARYTGLVFFHEGWPLCVHEKVVVQLASLRGVRLRPGDFYLQVTSVRKQSARLVLKCLSRLGGGSEEVAVPEAMYGRVFTAEFLEWLNGERNSIPLQNCLLTTGSAVYRIPWSNLTDPVFVPMTRTVLPSGSSHPGPEQLPPRSTLEVLAPAPALASPCPQGSTPSSATSTLLPHSGPPGSDQPSHLPHLRGSEWESPRARSGSSDRGLVGVGPSDQSPWEPPGSPEEPGGWLDALDKKDSPQAITFHRDTVSLSSRRRPPRDQASVEARRWFRKSYMEALRNPMPLGSSSEESLRDEACSSQTKEARAEADPTQKETPSPRGDPQGIPSEESSPGAAGRTLPRRSQSWDRSLRSSQSDSQWASNHSASARPWGLLGRQAAGTRNAGPSGPSCATAESPGCNKEEASVYTSGSSFRGQDVLAELLCTEGEGRLPGIGDSPNWVPGQVLEINQELLQSGVVTLPGTRDRQGRAVAQVCLRGPLWSSKHTSSAELICLLKYLHGIPRKEVRDLGLVILVDARKSPAAPALSQALAALQNTSPPTIHSILLLVDKESAFRPDKDATIQCEVVGSLKALHKLVDNSQLTADLEGSFPYSHSDWICFRRKVELFTTNCEDAIVFLQNSVRSLNAHRPLSTAQEVMESISKHKATMKRVLEDTLLVALRLEGGTVLARLRREEHGTSEDCRDTIQAASRLYNQLDEEVHRLVLTSNRCLQELENLRELRMLEEGGDQSVLQEGGDQQHCQKGLQLAEEHNSQDAEGTVQDFRRCQSAMAGQAEWRDGELASRAHPSEFYESVNRWMLRGSECLEPWGPELVAKCLPEAVEAASESFPRASAAVPGLGGQRVLGQWLAFGLQCQQTPLHSQEALPGTALGPAVPLLGRSPLKHKLAQGAKGRHHEPPWVPLADPKGRAGEWAQLLPSLPGQAALCGQESEHLSPGVPTLDSSSPCSSESIQTSAGHPRKHPLKKIMKKTQNFEIPQLNSDSRDSRWPGHTGAFIKGLEVTSTVASEKKPPLRPCAESPLVTRNRSLSSPSRIQSTKEDGRRRAGSNRLQHVMAEMISTEREYVRSLGYVIDNYFPEMERMDLPQDLRGKRSIIFGNLEKLHDFHCQHFLNELEHCRHCPWAVGRGFLRHEKQFGMYALYSKNKPQSDALLCGRGNAFFEDKQRKLGDKMDLASYLLKPVQRLGKYALLLQDLVREAGRCPAHEQELGELQAAEDMVRFQLRHGNDLLATDAVRGCDVNLKEQGQLRCQNEFVVCCGRKKYPRHVFLFEELILFSKTKKVDGGHDIYEYKQSFKTAEIGMTENVGDSGLRFEIWFRRRWKSQDTYILQASSTEVKAAWTHAIGKILWQQALRNRELRRQEMVSMGMGDKPFVDIKPSDAAINDRAIDYIMQGTGSRTRASIAVPSCDHTAPFKRPHSTISDSSTSSSSSQASSALGQPTLHVSTSLAHRGLLSPTLCPWPCDISTCIEEDELETGSQPSTRECMFVLEQRTLQPQQRVWVGEPVHMFVCFI
ncbi:hypothetical protein HPG69_009366 [Diceros bicornis minor]|uniref:Pleckstrin homology domain-containing family G member 4B n=1 Tax=Diceros bicornis minor TaxID=77932 RepID=A0A7J7EGI4_DICBM|nr:hypothetical protein HPG69_009366 [Diceros bicornis minor]